MSDEEKKPEESKDESKPEESKDESPSSSELSPLEQGKQTLKEMKEQTLLAKKEADRLERLQADDMLGGTSTAGQAPIKPVKLDDRAYAEAMEKGEVDPFKEDGFV